jgi:drug/metabolite transporter (DMT)-like permease
MTSALSQEVKACFWGLLGIIGFGLTLPATKIAVPFFGFTTVGLGRAVISGFLGLVLLLITHSKLPKTQQIFRLIIVSLGVVFGFPFFSAYAMKYVPASHGAIVIGILPLFTAFFGVILAKEQPPLGYWLAGLIGSLTIVIYSIFIGGGVLQSADFALLLAAISAAIGYAEGARLSQELGSWRTICYALVLSLPVTIPLSLLSAEMNLEYNSLAAWSGFFYLSLVSMFLAFFAWYRGMELGGIAKIGQLQLLQPFITIFASNLFFGEKLSSDMFVVLTVVLFSVYFGRKSYLKI